MEEEKKVSLKKEMGIAEEMAMDDETIAVEVVDSFVVEDEHGTHQEFQAFSESMSGARGDGFVPIMDKNVHVGLKWAIGLFVLFTGYIGIVTGLMIGFCFLKSPYTRGVRYGRNLIICCIIYLVICIALSFLGGILNLAFRLLSSILGFILA